MVDSEAADERGLIRAVDEHLTETYGVVVDDVVLRTWGNQQVELTYLLLSAAITASGGEVDEADLWRVARAIAFPAPLVDAGRVRRAPRWVVRYSTRRRPRRGPIAASRLCWCARKPTRTTSRA